MHEDPVAIPTPNQVAFCLALADLHERYGITLNPPSWISGAYRVTNRTPPHHEFEVPGYGVEDLRAAAGVTGLAPTLSMEKTNP